MGHDEVAAGRGAGLPLAVLSAAAFGLSGALARGLLNAGWSPGAIVLVRLGVGALALVPFVATALRGRRGLLRRHAGLILVYGAVPMALAQFAYFSAVAHMDVGPALLIEYTAPAAVVVWLWLRRGERPSAVTLVGAGVAALGLVLVLGLLSGAHVVLAGVLWALVAMAAAATYFLLGADASAEVPPLSLAGCGLGVGAVALGLLGAVGVLPLTATTASPRYGAITTAWWVPLLGLGLVTAALAYATGIAAMRRLGSRVASFVGLLEALAGVVAAWLALGQALGATQVLGALLVGAGVLAVNRGETGVAAGAGEASADARRGLSSPRALRRAHRRRAAGARVPDREALDDA